MIKQILSQYGYGIFAEVALVAFVLIFLAIVLHTLTRSHKMMEEHASIPLDLSPFNDSESEKQHV